MKTNIVILVVLTFLLGAKCNNNYPYTSEMFFSIDSSKITSLKIIANDREFYETDFERLDKFISLMKRCTDPIEMRNLRVIDRYRVEIKIDHKMFVYHFHRKNGYPFIMSLWSRGSSGGLIGTYKCEEMENFLRKYK